HDMGGDEDSEVTLSNHITVPLSNHKPKGGDRLTATQGHDPKGTCPDNCDHEQRNMPHQTIIIIHYFYSNRFD
ncbi:hypothetical protein RA263_29225, partial [Pseudomonas syringae pv. tagetis]